MEISMHSFVIGQINSSKALLEGELMKLANNDASYTEDGSWTTSAYKEKVATEQAIDGLNMALANLEDIKELESE